MSTATHKRFLNQRKTRNLFKAQSSAREVISDWENMRIRTALGHKLNRRSRISLVRPWWMPGKLYIWLLSTIVADAE